MKKIALSLLLLNPAMLWAEQGDTKQLGHALANYQACSEIFVAIGDEQMFAYYRRMFNDLGLSLLTFDEASATQVYSAWQRSEKVLLTIDAPHLKTLCLSRLDELTKNMLKK